MTLINTGIFLTGLLLLLDIASSKLSARLGMPVLVLFLGVGILAGSEGLGGIFFENYGVANGIGSVALALILFNGGLRTSLGAVRSAWRPAITLSTVGVLLTAALTGLAAAYVLDLPLLIAGGGVAAGTVGQAIRKQAFRLVREISLRQHLQAEVLEATEREQRRIGRDLHDGLGSHLTGVSMLCRGLARRLSKGQPIEQGEIEGVAQMIEEGVAQARLLSHGLNPAPLGSGDLADALRELATGTQTATGIPSTFMERGTAPPLGQEAATHLYRIAQEAVNNATKHAHPSHINLTLATQDGHLVLTVEDDGTGRPAERTSDGLGLRSMRQRARLIGAELSVEDAPGGGTIVRATLPF